MTQWVALMPLRGGSKSIPGKNIRPLAGHPLFAWSLEQAIASNCFDAIYVATDAESIRAVVREYFPTGVTLIDRSPETATDTASTESVMLEFQQRVPFDVLGLIQATSPLTRAEDFRAARTQFETGGFDSLVTATPLHRFLWNPDGTPMNYDPAQRPRRQDMSPMLMENGAFYLTRGTVLEQHRCRLGVRVAVHVMPPETETELDEPSDWERVEHLLLDRRRGSAYAAAAQVQALVLDVDGTLTDGGMYYDANGEKMKRFSTRDGKGLERLRALGIRVCVITGEDSPAVAARMRKLQITDYFPGVTDKLRVLKEWAATTGLQLQDIAFMGDDTGDLECLQNVGLPCCPADATAEILAAAKFVCNAGGGRGAVREVCELIIKMEPTGGPRPI